MKILLLCGCLFFVACNYPGDSIRAFSNIASEKKAITDNIFYVKDSSTGLCFAVLKSEVRSDLNSYSIACVSCDSLKKVLK
jgi:hypothetical protein